MSVPKEKTLLDNRVFNVPTERFTSREFTDHVEHLSEQRALSLFNEVYARVPAYRSFLRENGVNALSIRTIEDFKNLPYIDKENYLRRYSLEELVWDGDLSRQKMISRSSGSSGKPFYWPRGYEQEQEVNYIYSNIYKTFFQCDKKKTLIVGGFALGSWVGGTFNLSASLEFSNDNPTTLLTPGYNKDEIIELVESLSKYYEQTIIGAYPPFAKEIIDTGTQKGVDWTKYNVKFFCAAETFSEEFRDYLLRAVGAEDSILSSVNIIGTADAAIVGHETPLSIAIRRYANNRRELWDELFPAFRTPTLGQYYPWLKHFEELNNGELLFTSNGGIPLIRYNIHDHGAIWSFEKMMSILEEGGSAESISKLVGSQNMWQLPFVCIYGKSDQTVPVYGAKVYPENVRSLLELKEWSDLCSGKFLMSLEYDKALDGHIKLEIELQHDINATEQLNQKMQGALYEHLRSVNTEFAEVSRALGVEKTIPNIELIGFGDERFRSDLKLKWVKSA